MKTKLLCLIAFVLTLLPASAGTKLSALPIISSIMESNKLYVVVSNAMSYSIYASNLLESFKAFVNWPASAGGTNNSILVDSALVPGANLYTDPAPPGGFKVVGWSVVGTNISGYVADSAVAASNAALALDLYDFWEDFNRPDSTNLGASSPSSHPIILNGPQLGSTQVTNYTRISNGFLMVDPWLAMAIPTNPTVYYKVQLARPPTEVGMRVRQRAGLGGSSSVGSATIVASRSADWITRNAHFHVQYNGANLTISTNGVAGALVLTSFEPSSEITNNEIMEIGMQYLGNGLISLRAYHTNVVVYHPMIEEIWGPYIFFESGNAVTNTVQIMDIDAMWAGARRSIQLPHDYHFGITTNGPASYVSTNPPTVYWKPESAGLMLRDFWDDFDRPNGDGAIGDTSPSGHEISLCGPVYTTASTNCGRVTNGWFVTDVAPAGHNGTAFYKIALPTAPTAIGGRVRQVDGGGLTNAAYVVLSASPSLDWLSKHVQLVFQSNSIITRISLNGTTERTNVSVLAYSITNGQSTEISIERIGEDLLNIRLLGTNFLVHHPNVSEAWGNHVWFQIGSPYTNMGAMMEWDNVWADGRASAFPVFSSEFALTTNSVDYQAPANAPTVLLTSNLIMAKTVKSPPVAGDMVLLSDSESGWELKRVDVSALLGGGTNISVTNDYFYTNALATSNTLYLMVGGDDSNAIKGRLDRPWGTFSNAVKALTNNETLVIFPGDYYVGLVSNACFSILYNTENASIIGVQMPRLICTNIEPAKAGFGSALVIENCRKITVSGIEFVGETSTNKWYGSNAPSMSIAIQLVPTNNLVKIEGCRFIDWTRFGIADYNSFATFDTGIDVLFNYFRNCGSTSFVVNTPANPSMDGAAIVLTGSRLRAIGNRLDSCMRGIEIFNTGASQMKNIDVSVNLITSNSGAALLVLNDGHGSNLQDIRISGNIVDGGCQNWNYVMDGNNHSAHAWPHDHRIINIQNAQGLEVSRNTFVNCDLGLGGGVEGAILVHSIYSGARNYNFVGNVIRNIMDGPAFEVYGSSILAMEPLSSVTICQNTIDTVARSGITVQANDCVIQANTIHDIGTNSYDYPAIWVRTAGWGRTNCTNVLITGNLVADSKTPTTKHGIRVDADAYGVNVLGNFVGSGIIPFLNAGGGSVVFGIGTNDVQDLPTLAGYDSNNTYVPVFEQTNMRMAKVPLSLVSAGGGGSYTTNHYYTNLQVQVQDTDLPPEQKLAFKQGTNVTLVGSNYSGLSNVIWISATGGDPTGTNMTALKVTGGAWFSNTVIIQLRTNLDDTGTNIVGPVLWVGTNALGVGTGAPWLMVTNGRVGIGRSVALSSYGLEVATGIYSGGTGYYGGDVTVTGGDVSLGAVSPTVGIDMKAITGTKTIVFFTGDGTLANSSSNNLIIPGTLFASNGIVSCVSSNVINANALWVGTNADGTLTPWLVVSNGLIGIKKAVPVYELDVNGSFLASGAIMGNTSVRSGTGHYIFGMGTANQTPVLIRTNGSQLLLYDFVSGPLLSNDLLIPGHVFVSNGLVSAGGSNLFTGNVGIGTNAPQAKLDIWLGTNTATVDEAPYIMRVGSARLNSANTFIIGTNGEIFVGTAPSINYGAGSVNAGNYIYGASGLYTYGSSRIGFASRSRFKSPTNGLLTAVDSTETAFSSLLVLALTASNAVSASSVVASNVTATNLDVMGSEAGAVKLYDLLGVESASFRAPPALSETYRVILPTNAPTTGQVMVAVNQSNVVWQGRHVFPVANAVAYLEGDSADVFAVDCAFAERTVVMSTNICFTNVVQNAPAAGNVAFVGFTVTNALGTAQAMMFDSTMVRWAPAASTNVPANGVARVSIEVHPDIGTVAYSYIVKQ